MNYKQILFLFSAASLFGISGCDVSSGGGGGESQSPDPVVVDFPIAYIERPIPRDEEGEFIPDDILELTAFNPGARLLLKDRASVPADAMVITDIAFMPEASDEDAQVPDENSEATPEPRPLYDVKDLSVNAEGTKLLFAMRAPELADAGEEEQPSWNIWEYDLETEILRRIIESDIIAEEGQDIMPAYLADGSIIFSSNRQRRSRAVLLDENKPQFSALTEDGEETEAFLMHVMEDDGTEIKQISFNQSHDLYPSLLDDGRVMFLRWDNYHGGKDRLSLYTANPNGSNVNLEYGFHSQMTGSNNTEGVFTRPRELLDDRIQVTLRPRVSAILGGGMIAIDTQNYTDLNIPVSGTGGSGPAQTALVEGSTTTDGSPSLAGYYSSAYPINESEGRLLVSWSPCLLNGLKLGVFVDDTLQLIDENGSFVNRQGNASAEAVTIEQDEVGYFPCTAAAISQQNIQQALPVYGLWLFNPLNQEQAPVVLPQQETMYTEAIVIQARPLPNFIGEPVPGIDFDAELESENVGIVHIRSVYDLDGSDASPNGISTIADPLQTPENQRPARFIRIVKAVSQADDDVVDFDPDAYGVARNHMKDILGYVPVEPDGSAMFKVPADVAFSFSILDANGKRIATDGSGEPGQRHEYWMALRAGELRQCNGCHTDDQTETPHGRHNAEPESINPGALAAAPFANTQLRDEFGTPHTAPEIGETMAQYFARVNGPRTPSVNILDYSDWTEDGSNRPKLTTTDFSYSDLRTEAPTECGTDWNSLCRIVINYLDHIQPLWELARVTTDPENTEVVLADNTCIRCHARQYDGMVMIPAGTPPRQLNLAAEQVEGENYYTASYVNLFAGVLRQELLVDSEGNVVAIQNETEPQQSEQFFLISQLMIDGALQFQATDLNNNIVPVPSNNTNPDFTLVLDEAMNPIPFIAYVLDSSGQRVLDPSPSGVQYAYLEVQLNINGVPQYQAVNGSGELVFAAIGTEDPELTLILDANNAQVPYNIFDFDGEGQRQINRVATGNRSPSLMSPAGATASDEFFSVFEAGGSHQGFLNGAELKLIAEWLDIGAQYYNNQFVAPP